MDGVVNLHIILLFQHEIKQKKLLMKYFTSLYYSLQSDKFNNNV